LRQFTMTGQVYSDQRFLEFNSFYFHFGNTELILNGEIDGVDLRSPDFTSQFLDARYNLHMLSTALYPRQLSTIMPAVPNIRGPLRLQLHTVGSTDALQVEEVSISKGESLLRLDGLFENLRQPEAFTYRDRKSVV